MEVVIFKLDGLAVMNLMEIQKEVTGGLGEYWNYTEESLPDTSSFSGVKSGFQKSVLWWEEQHIYALLSFIGWNYKGNWVGNISSERFEQNITIFVDWSEDLGFEFYDMYDILYQKVNGHYGTCLWWFIHDQVPAFIDSKRI